MKRRRLHGKQRVEGILPQASETQQSVPAKRRSRRGAPRAATKPEQPPQAQGRNKSKVTFAEPEAVPSSQGRTKSKMEAVPSSQSEQLSELEDKQVEAILAADDDDDDCPQLFSSDEDTISSSDGEIAQPMGSFIPRPVTRRRSDARAASYGLSGQCFRRLLKMGAPIILFNCLCTLFWCSAVSNSQDLSGVEFFAGIGTIYRHFRDAGLGSAQHDIIIDDDLHNFMSPCGWINALQLCRRLMAGGLASFATVCSTWIWCSRGSTHRSPQNPLAPEPRSAGVAEANAMVSRMVLLWYMIVASDSVFILEQPSSSLMALHPRIKAFGAALQNVSQRIHHCHLWMGMLGAPTPKATRLFSNTRQIARLHNTLDRSLFPAKSDTCIIDEDKKALGLPCTTGNKDKLHDTQEYPEQYGEEVLQLWQHMRRSQIQVDDSDSDATCEDPEPDAWDDAWAADISKFMAIPSDKMMV